jgi:hypothetical protein
MLRRFALAIVVATVACKDDPKPPPPPAEEGETDLRELATQPAPRVEVLDAGAEPREILVLAPAVGLRDRLEAHLQMKMQMRAGGQAIPKVVTPPISLVGYLVVDEVGDVIVARHLVDALRVGRDADAPAAVVEELERLAPAVASFRASLRIDPHGSVRGGTVEVPQAAGGIGGQLLQQLGDGFCQLLVPLPETPIGVGARWIATTRIDQGGMPLQQRVTYELRGRQGRTLDIAAHFEQALLDSTIPITGAPGVTVHVELFKSRGEGTMRIDLDHVVPTRSELTLQVRMVMNPGGDAGAAGQQEIDLELAYEFSR